MGLQLTSKRVGQLAGLLLVGSGALAAVTLPLPQPAGTNRVIVLFVSALAVALGGLAFVFPWHRLPHRASLVLLPAALTLVALGNHYGNAQAYAYSIYFVVAFVWTGLGHDRGTSIAMAPLAAVAYALPFWLEPEGQAVGLASAALVVPVCVFVGEAIGWVGLRDRRSRERTSALARVATALGSHLNVRELSTTLTDEVRVALDSEIAIFVQLESDGRTVKDLFGAGEHGGLDDALNALRGHTFEDNAPFAALTAGEPVVVTDTKSIDGIKSEPLRYGLRSYMAMPVLVGDRLGGILACGQVSKARRYATEDVALARALASQASAALHNAVLYEKTHEAARCDPLTGLGNRRAFHERLEEEVRRAQRYERKVSVSVLDLDGLKAVNDAWGHLAGDRVLVKVARLLEESRTGEAQVYRMGGDEFAVILPETDCDQAMDLADKLRHTIERAGLGTEGRDLTASVGVCTFPDHGVEPDELFERADTVLYRVKWSGGNAASAAVPREAQGPGTRYGLDVTEIIERRRLLALYQPIVSLDDEHVIGYEAFARLDPALGNVPITTVFRAAGALGLTADLDRLCREVAMENAALLGGEKNLFLNIAPASMEDERFDADQILTAIAAAGLDVGQVVLELTELERVGASDQLVRNLITCRHAGLKLALDDFGAASHDLELMSRVDFDFVKIDTGYVKDAHTDASRQRLLNGLRVLAETAGASTIAEGVETLEDMDMVKRLGFQATQGYYIEEPLPTLGEPNLGVVGV